MGQSFLNYLSITDKFFKTRRGPLFKGFTAFKLTVGCIFEGETTKMKLTENIKRRIFMQKLFCDVIYYQILMLNF